MARGVLATILGLTIVGSMAVPAWQATAQSEVQVVIERPLAGTPASTTLEVAGYAYDPNAATGTGIDAVHVYIDGEPGQRSARFLGEASHGLRRPDLAGRVSDPRFTSSGFSLLTEVTPGNHTLFVYVHLAGAPPDDGWVRASLPAFEVSLVAPRPTMVQPGPAAVGSDDGRYRTGNTSWQGGGTCMRYNGRGECEQSVPFGIATGASCIQWNQRGQCVSYMPGEGATIGNTPVQPAPTRAAPAEPALVRVPTVGAAGVRTAGAAPAAGSNPSTIRVVAPPPAGEEGAPAEGALPVAAAVAPPPGFAPASDSGAPAVRAAAPPPQTTTTGSVPAASVAVASAPPALAPAAGTLAAPAPQAPAQVPPPQTPAQVPPPQTSGPLEFPVTSGGIGGDPIPLGDTAGSPAPAPAAPSGGTGRGSIVTMGEGGEAFAPPEGYRGVETVVQPAVPVAPQVVATQTALQGTAPSVSGSGQGSLRSGCALYLGCSDQAPASGPRATPTATPAPGR